MRDRKGWKALGYESFKDYGEKELGYQEAHIYRLVEAAEVSLQIGYSPIGESAPPAESQLRPLNDPFPWFSVCLYVVQNSVKDSKKGLSRTQLIRAATGKDGGAAEIEAKRRGDAGEVLQYLMEQSYHMERLLDPDTNLTRNLSEIHAAPNWLWSALGGFFHSAKTA